MEEETGSRELADKVIEYLYSEGVREEILKNAVVCKPEHESVHVWVRSKIFRQSANSVYLYPAGNKLHPPAQIPSFWLNTASCEVSEKECEAIAERHPQRCLIGHVTISIQQERAIFYITEKEDCPFVLESAVIAKQKGSGLTQSSVNCFLRQDLIISVKPELRNQAALAIFKREMFRIAQFKSLAIPSGVAGKKGILSILNAEDTAEIIADRIRFESGMTNVIFQYKQFSLFYSVKNRTFGKPKDPFGGLIAALQKRQREILAANEAGDRLRLKIGSNCPDNLYGTYLIDDLSGCFLRIRYRQYQKDFSVPSSPDRESVYVMVKKCVDFINSMDEKDAKREKLLETVIRPNRFYGSLLAVSIIDTVKKNQKNALSTVFGAEEIVHIVQYGAIKNLKRGKYAARFSRLPKKYIEDCLTELTNAGVLKSKVTSSGVSLCKSYSIADKERARFFTNPEMRKNPEDFTDIQWLSWMKEKKPGLKWEEKLKLFDHPGVYCVDSKNFLRIFRRAPKTVLDYIRMAGEIEEDQVKKKLYNDVYDILTKKS